MCKARRCFKSRHSFVSLCNFLNVSLGFPNVEAMMKFTFRQSGGGGELLQPVLPMKNVTFSTMTVAGVEWVCEQLSETQCKPLYPKVKIHRT